MDLIQKKIVGENKIEYRTSTRNAQPATAAGDQREMLIYNARHVSDSSTNQYHFVAVANMSTTTK